MIKKITRGEWRPSANEFQVIMYYWSFIEEVRYVAKDLSDELVCEQSIVAIFRVKRKEDQP